jgi:hypothetical protein
VKRRTTFSPFAAGIGLFLLALALRTADPLVCEAFPLGTHFAWHLLNGAVLYILSRALAREAAGVG